MSFWFLVLSTFAYIENDASKTLLQFGSLHCSACQQMQPLIDRLHSEGWNVRSIDTEKDRVTANRWSVKEVPTIIVLHEGREVDRIVGSQSDSLLRTRLGKMEGIGGSIGAVRSAPVPRKETLSVDSNSLIGPNHPASRWLPRNDSVINDRSYPDFVEPHPLLGDRHPFHHAPVFRQPRSDGLYAGNSRAPSKKLPKRPVFEIHPLLNGARLPTLSECMSATVRIRVEHPRSESVGTGTVIETASDETIVLTCGHLFRERDNRDPVFVELFTDGKTTKVSAKVIDFRIENGDIGLISFKSPFPISPIAILPKGEKPREEDPVFSIGCDEGAPPTRRETIISKLNRYLGSSNIEIAGAPTQGRSGGGLFDAKGRLIGVCHAADYDLDEGLYGGPEVIHALLEKHRLNRNPTGL